NRSRRPGPRPRTDAVPPSTYTTRFGLHVANPCFATNAARPWPAGLTRSDAGVPSLHRSSSGCGHRAKETQMRRFLIVGNQTLASAELRAAVRDRLTGEPSQFHIVVPATPPREHFSWSEGEATTVA